MSSIARRLSEASAEDLSLRTTVANGKDYFAVRNGVPCAGIHLIADFWGARRLTELVFMRRSLVQAARAADATLLDISLHHFTPNDGISGVAVLAESHISVHTWPERGYAAFDVFMCGAARPELAVESLREAFEPARVEIHEILRGRVQADG